MRPSPISTNTSARERRERRRARREEEVEEERRGTSRPATPLGTYCTSVWWRSGPLESEEWTTALPLGPQGSPRAPRPESSPQESPIPPWLLDTSLVGP